MKDIRITRNRTSGNTTVRTTRRLGPKALRGRQEWIETVTNATESGDWDCLEEI